MSDPDRKVVVSEMQYTLLVEALIRMNPDVMVSPEAREIVLRTRSKVDKICQIGGIPEEIAVDMMRLFPRSLETILQHFLYLEELSK